LFLFGQTPESDYEKLKADMVAQFQNTPPGKVGSFVKVGRSELTHEKILALTFDALPADRMETAMIRN